MLHLQPRELAARAKKNRVLNPRPQGVNGGGYSMTRTTCSNCAKRHDGKSHVGMDGFFHCEKSGHTVRDCPMLRIKGRDGKQSLLSVTNFDAPKKKSYALQSRGDQESSPDVVICML